MWKQIFIEDEPIECWGLNIGESNTFTDPRDNEIYSIARLSDGKCWMTQNLRIINKSIDSSNSDLNEGSSYVIPNSSTNGFDSSNNNNQSAHYVYWDDYRCDGYSGIYSYYVATAGSGSTAVSFGEAKDSICPKGWRLPTGGPNGEYQNLYDLGYNETSKLTTYPIPYFHYDGYLENNAFVNRGSVARLWTSTINSDNTAYSFAFGQNEVINPANEASKHLGYSVRCVARGQENQADFYRITYDTSGANCDTVSNKPSPNPQGEMGVAGGNIRLNSITPTSECHNFKGWCTVQPTNGSCIGGSTYQPGQYIQVGNKTPIKLYAIWEKVSDSCRCPGIPTCQRYF